MFENILNGQKVRIDMHLSKLLIQGDKKNYFATKNGQVVSLGEVDGFIFIPRKVLL